MNQNSEIWLPIPAFMLRGGLLFTFFLLYITAGMAQTYNRIQFTVGTGADDLRGDSSATATLFGTNGAALQTITLKAQNASGWNNNTTNTVTAALNPGITRAAIGRIGITMASHKSGFESDDNWNVQNVTVTLSNNGAGPVTLVSASGNPLGRLTTSAPSMSLTVPAVAVSGTYNQIQLTVTTGDDDLRGDSSATATLQSPAGATLQVITLKSQSDAGWDKGTSKTISAALNPALTPAAIGHISIAMASHNSITESDDNWNIQSFSATLTVSGGSAKPLMSFSGAPLARLTGSQRSVTLPPTVAGPAGTFNDIQFTIVTGDDDLRGDSSATATLQSANGALLQTVAMKKQGDPSWDKNTTHTVTAPLTPPLTPGAVSHIVVTMNSHNSTTETDDNWNLQSFAAVLSNNGVGVQALMSFSGSPLARLTGVQPALTLPPPRANAGLGMTMPVNPPAETITQNINPALPNGVLPYGYQVPPSGFADASSHLDETCPIPKNKINAVAKNSCLPTWNGQVTEQTNRVNPFLRANAAAQDAKLVLVRAMWFSVGMKAPGAVASMDCGGSNAACATALAQLSVTGRRAYDSFVSWNPSFAPSSSGPQVSDLAQLARQGYKDAPAMPASITDAQLDAASSAVLKDAYTALWAIRANDPAWKQYRLNGSWIAVSGEDDSPHRPVNVPTAPFPQFDVPVPVTIGGRPYTLTGRFMLAAKQTQMSPALAPTPAPAVPMASGGRLVIPSDTPTALLNGALRSKNVIVYIHGGGSRLEEAVPMAEEFVTKFGAWSDNMVVVSFDLPDSAYNDTTVVPAGGGPRIALDASGPYFENGPNGGGPQGFDNFPVLNFTLNYINNMIATLGSNGIINPKQVLAVMGGSLGGNTSFLLGMNPLPAPLHLENALSFSAPASAPGGAQPTIVSWSPTSMVSVSDNGSAVKESNMCCFLTNGAGPTWKPEDANTRADYIDHVYFSETAPGLPSDPEMWYRGDWTDAQGHNLTASFITQSRYDRYEIYSPAIRLWTTAIDTEQAVFSFQKNTDASGQTYSPNYRNMRARVLLATGGCDDYDNGLNASTLLPQPSVPQTSVSTGTCAGQRLGKTGLNNRLTHQDIYGFTHDVANDMRNATGKTLFLNDTGHSIHDERPVYFSQQIYEFLTTPDNNVNITLRTGSDDLRWNSEVHAILGYTAPGSARGTLDFPLNYWFHPWPAAGISPNNPCGACDYLNAFHFAGAASEGTTTDNNFTIALPANVQPGTIGSFQIEFIAGTSSPGNTTDEWKLAGVAACLPGAAGGFVSDGFSGNGVVYDFKPSSNNQPVLWQPPSFQSPAISSRPHNCSPVSTNPPANSDVQMSIWNGGVQLGQ